MNLNPIELRRRVQIACLVRNSSIPKLAKELNITRQALYSGIYCGSIGINRILAIADVPDVSVDFLLGTIPLEITGVWSHCVKKEGG
nr:MAG TPA: SOS-response transcriptional repressor [Bacteriophage sp.]